MAVARSIGLKAGDHVLEAERFAGPGNETLTGTPDRNA
jgi:hypothetical protein